MTDILSALKECAANDDVHLTRAECNQLIGLIEGASHEIYMTRKNLASLEDVRSLKEQYISKFINKKDSPTVNAIKWSGRILAAVVSLFSLFFIIETWQNVALYWVCLLTVGTIFVHAIGMVFEWWHK